MKPSNFIRTMNYENCAELDAPELFFIMNNSWAQENKEAIRNSQGISGIDFNTGFFFIMDPNDRLLFALRWP